MRRYVNCSFVAYPELSSELSSKLKSAVFALSPATTDLNLSSPPPPNLSISLSLFSLSSSSLTFSLSPPPFSSLFLSPFYPPIPLPLSLSLIVFPLLPPFPFSSSCTLLSATSLFLSSIRKFSPYISRARARIIRYDDRRHKNRARGRALHSNLAFTVTCNSARPRAEPGIISARDFAVSSGKLSENNLRRECYRCGATRAAHDEFLLVRTARYARFVHANSVDLKTVKKKRRMSVIKQNVRVNPRA